MDDITLAAAQRLCAAITDEWNALLRVLCNVSRDIRQCVCRWRTLYTTAGPGSRVTQIAIDQVGTCVSRLWAALGVCREAVPAVSTPVPVSAICRELDGVRKLWPGTTITEDKIVVPLGEIILYDDKEEIRLGEFWLDVRTTDWEVTVKAKSPFAQDGDYFHPHVSTMGEVCLGDGLDMVRTAKLFGQLANYIELHEAILQTYAPDRAYTTLSRLTGEGPVCSDCGRDLRDLDDAYVGQCDRCSATICIECLQTCSECDADVCYACWRTCEVCCRAICADCYKACEVCGACVCADCVDNCTECEQAGCDKCLRDCEGCCQRFCDDCLDDGTWDGREARLCADCMVESRQALEDDEEEDYDDDGEE